MHITITKVSGTSTSSFVAAISGDLTGRSIVTFACVVVDSDNVAIGVVDVITVVDLVVATLWWWWCCRHS